MSIWDIDHLPSSLKDLVDVIGLAATQKLVSVYGGLRIIVPVKIPETHPLAELLGLETARKLSEHYALERIDLPNAKAAVQAVRDQKMQEEHRAGVSARKLAFQYRLTERRVWEILAGIKVDDRQTDMFSES